MDNTLDIFDRKYTFTVLIFLILALVLRLVYIYITPIELTGDSYYYNEMANNLLNGEGYHSNNMHAYQPPGYAFFLFLIYSISSDFSIRIVQFFQAILGVLQCFLVFLITSLLFGIQAGILALLLASIYPQYIMLPQLLLSENLFIPLFFAALLFYLKALMTSQIYYFAVSGILFGISALTRDVAWVFMLFILISIAIYSPKGWYFKIKSYLLLIFAAILIISPWTLRNYYIFRSFVPISTNFGINFYMGNNPNATGHWKWILPDGVVFQQKDCPKSHPPDIIGYHELEHVAKPCTKEAIDFIWHNKKKFLQLSLKKFFYLWRPPYYNINSEINLLEATERVIWLLSYIVLVTFAVFGIIVSRSQWRLISIFYLLILCITVIHVLTIPMVRYRLPAMYVLTIFAGSGIANLFSRILLN